MLAAFVLLIFCGVWCALGNAQQCIGSDQMMSFVAKSTDDLFTISNSLTAVPQRERDQKYFDLRLFTKKLYADRQMGVFRLEPTEPLHRDATVTAIYVTLRFLPLIKRESGAGGGGTTLTALPKDQSTLIQVTFFPPGESFELMTYQYFQQNIGVDRRPLVANVTYLNNGNRFSTHVTQFETTPALTFDHFKQGALVYARSLTVDEQLEYPFDKHTLEVKMCYRMPPTPAPTPRPTPHPTPGASGAPTPAAQTASTQPFAVTTSSLPIVNDPNMPTIPTIANTGNSPGTPQSNVDDPNVNDPNGAGSASTKEEEGSSIFTILVVLACLVGLLILLLLVIVIYKALHKDPHRVTDPHELQVRSSMYHDMPLAGSSMVTPVYSDAPVQQSYPDHNMQQSFAAPDMHSSRSSGYHVEQTPIANGYSGVYDNGRGGNSFHANSGFDAGFGTADLSNYQPLAANGPF